MPGSGAGSGAGSGCSGVLLVHTRAALPLHTRVSLSAHPRLSLSAHAWTHDAPPPAPPAHALSRA
eukprot:356097-Rhodomonas_salina.1